METTTTTQPPEPSGPAFTVRFVDGEGWSYEKRFDFPAGITFSKDISESPPGHAKLVSTLVGPLTPDDLSVPPNNPGRSGGPRRNIEVWYLFPGPEVSGGGCHPYPFLNMDHEIKGTACRAWTRAADTLSTGEEEWVIDWLIDQASTTKRTPVIIEMTDGQTNGCAFSALIGTDNSVVIRPNEYVERYGCTMDVKLG